MALYNPTGRATASSSTNTVSKDCTETLANQQTEIEKLTALLAAAEARTDCTKSILSIPEQTIAILIESIVQVLDRSSKSILKPKQLVKIPSLATLTDSQNPIFENWKI